LARLLGVAIGLALVAGLPAVVVAHGLSPVYQSPLPLAVYLAGAAATVALSFLFVLARDMRAGPVTPTRVVTVPGLLRFGLRLVGLVGWSWIMLQGLAGGTSPAAVASLFLWVYGWVGLAAVSALIGPIWEWLDPFATLYDMLAWMLRRLGIRGWRTSPIPHRLRLWPAALGFAGFVWLELVAVVGAEALTVVLLVYTLLTLALMANFGRDAWRMQGETFTVWFRTLNLLAPVGTVPGPADARRADSIDTSRVMRRPFAAGLLEATWTAPRIVLVAMGTGSIIFDGLSQTVAFAALFGSPAVAPKTLILLGFLGVVAIAALLVARAVSPSAIGAGLLPIAVGYLVAHYLTYLLIDGQRILIAISDPLQRGDDLFGTAFFVPSGGWLPPGLVWTMQLVAVVGGHMLGAWAGHVTAQRDMDAALAESQARDIRHRKVRTPGTPMRARNIRAREIPLAIVMVALTMLTLWSLGQSIVVVEETASRPEPVSPSRLGQSCAPCRLLG
jgi:hypothetical protein